MSNSTITSDAASGNFVLLFEGQRTAAIPHDADPTFALRFDHHGRRAAIVTDMGHPRSDAAREIGPVDWLLLEFNHDAELPRFR